MRKAMRYAPGVEANRVRAARQAMKTIRNTYGMMSKIAAGVGIKPQAVHQWEVVPLDKIITVERITGIPRYELRPDYHQGPADFKAA